MIKEKVKAIGEYNLKKRRIFSCNGSDITIR